MRCESDVASGMRRLLEHCDGLCPGAVWSEIAELDFAADAYLQRRLRELLETEPPDEDIVALWFGLFDETSPDSGAFARLYLAGAESYDPDETNSAWACSPAYFPNGRYADSAVLRSISKVLSGAGEDILWLGSYVLPLGYTSLAIADACRGLSPDTLLGRPSTAVAVGFDSGDSITLPVIRPSSTLGPVVGFSITHWLPPGVAGGHERLVARDSEGKAGLLAHRDNFRHGLSMAAHHYGLASLHQID